MKAGKGEMSIPLSQEKAQLFIRLLFPFPIVKKYGMGLLHILYTYLLPGTPMSLYKGRLERCNMQLFRHITFYAKFVRSFQWRNWFFVILICF
jgi:hypothetical protein